MCQIRIDRKGIPPAPGQGEYPSHLYGLTFSVTFSVVLELVLEFVLEFVLIYRKW